MNTEYAPIRFKDSTLYLLDQRKLPHEEIFIVNQTLQDGYDSIKNMVVRGAPCIGFTAIYTMALWVKNHPNFSFEEFTKAAQYLKTARPTAVNLAFELEQTIELVRNNLKSTTDFFDLILNFAQEQLALSEKRNRAMAQTAEKELQSKFGDKKLKLMTHCNTGFLACGSIGTALGVIQHMAEQDKIEKAWVDETRPYLQGSRLTAYELSKLGVSYDVVVEGATSYLMTNGLVDAVFVGADRIVSNGDTANKIGTSNLAIIARNYKVPFYVVAPSSSFDLQTSSGEDIEIELRPNSEVLEYNGDLIAPENATALNPSFDVTKSNFITGIICEHGLIKPPYDQNIRKVVSNEKV
jgi:methylthioribose-1-phosphate isomerase